MKVWLVSKSQIEDVGCGRLVGVKNIHSGGIFVEGDRTGINRSPHGNEDILASSLTHKRHAQILGQKVVHLMMAIQCLLILIFAVK